MSRAAGEGGLALSLPTLEHAFMLQLVTSSRVPPARLQKLPAFFTEMRKQPKYQISLNLVLGAPAFSQHRIGRGGSPHTPPLRVWFLVLTKLFVVGQW